MVLDVHSCVVDKVSVSEASHLLTETVVLLLLYNIYGPQLLIPANSTEVLQLELSTS